MARLLEKYDEMQKQSPDRFGTNTALSAQNANGVGGTAGSQMRRQGEAYGRALRLLNRQARRGDANSALKAISVREEANAAGYSPGGIGRPEERNAGILGRIRSQTQAAADNEQFQNVARTAAMENMRNGLPAGGSDAGRPNAGTPNAGAPDGTNRRNGVFNRAPDGGRVFNPATSRNYAGLDILEGSGRVEGTSPFGDAFQESLGLASLQDQGVSNPGSLFQGGDPTLTYRQTLDGALGETTSPEGIAALRARGTATGITPAAFDRRAKWWERNRSR